MVQTRDSKSRLRVPAATANLQLWCLENPHSVAQQGPQSAVFTQVKSHRDLSCEQTPLLFLHGVEYDSPQEVVRDFVQPFLSALLQSHETPAQWSMPVYFVSWNSIVLSPTPHHSRVQSQSPAKRIFNILAELPRWGAYFSHVERRAQEAGQSLVPFVMEWCSERKVGPTVVSHSLGAKVWAETLKHILMQSRMLAKPGIWWNLQPALTRSAFMTGGEYEVVARMYNGGDHAKAVTWYSRLDFVLSTLFLIAKGAPALGQFGCPEATIPQRDVTRWVREAHGINHISSKLGSFFRRTAPLIPLQARELGIIRMQQF